MPKKKLTKKLITNLIEKREVASLRLLFSLYPLIDIAETVNHIDEPKELLFIMKTCHSDDTAELFSN
jgi:hypothetical protein